MSLVSFMRPIMGSGSKDKEIDLTTTEQIYNFVRTLLYNSINSYDLDQYGVGKYDFNYTTVNYQGKYVIGAPYYNTEETMKSFYTETGNGFVCYDYLYLRDSTNRVNRGDASWDFVDLQRGIGWSCRKNAKYDILASDSVNPAGNEERTDEFDFVSFSVGNNAFNAYNLCVYKNDKRKMHVITMRTSGTDVLYSYFIINAPEGVTFKL